MTRRSFLATAWKVGFGLLAVAGVVTSWDLLRPHLAAGFEAVVRTIKPEAVPEGGVVAVPEAKGYLVKVDGEIVAFSEVCSHLGCRVPYITETNQFECPCHGSKFTRDGFLIEGPAPRGMDQYAVEVVDGIIVIDTSDVTEGPPAGSRST